MVDLKELERRLDEALAKETNESLSTWLNNQRIEEHEKISWLPCTGEVVPISNADISRYLIEGYTSSYTPPPKQAKKISKKDSVEITESFFFIIIVLW